jgi:hypothetical protein
MSLHHRRQSKLTVLNLVVHPLKTETISIDRGHSNHLAREPHYHDLTYQVSAKHTLVMIIIIVINHRNPHYGLDASVSISVTPPCAG